MIEKLLDEIKDRLNHIQFYRGEWLVQHYFEVEENNCDKVYHQARDESLEEALKKALATKYVPYDPDNF